MICRSEGQALKENTTLNAEEELTSPLFSDGIRVSAFPSLVNNAVLQSAIAWVILLAHLAVIFSHAILHREHAQRLSLLSSVQLPGARANSALTRLDLM